MRYRVLLYIAGLLAIVTFSYDRFFTSISNALLYVSSLFIFVLLSLYIILNRKYDDIKEAWKSWNIVQKVVLFLMIITNIYILGIVNLFSDLIFILIYVGLNYTLYVLILKPKYK